MTFQVEGDAWFFLVRLSKVFILGNGADSECEGVKAEFFAVLGDYASWNWSNVECVWLTGK